MWGLHGSLSNEAKSLLGVHVRVKRIRNSTNSVSYGGCIFQQPPLMLSQLTLSAVDLLPECPQATQLLRSIMAWRSGYCICNRNPYERTF